jgi:dTDP-4-dehydrorhamnose 3,5-epimerase-like enzyme
MTDLERAPSTLAGVRYGAVQRHADSRGAFRELWRASTFPTLSHADTGAPADREPRFVQANLSSTSAGVLRGLHNHRHQLD